MPLYVTYSASLSQTGSGPITASLGGKNTITGSWSRLSAGTYQLVSSGNFAPTVSSGSVTGSLGLAFTYIPNDSNDTGSGFILYATSSNALILQTFASAYPSVYPSGSDNLIKGNLQLQVGALSGSIWWFFYIDNSIRDLDLRSLFHIYK